MVSASKKIGKFKEGAGHVIGPSFQRPLSLE
jgi:hypothetical protein